MTWRRRIGAHALLHVRAIDTGRSDLDEDLAVTDLGHGHGGRLQNLGASFAVEGDAGHCRWDRGHGTSPSVRAGIERAELKAGPAKGGKRRRSIRCLRCPLKPSPERRTL